MSEQTPRQTAMAKLYEMVDREGGLTNLVFDAALSPNLLPEGTPPDVLSAWIRLQHAAKDLDLIQKRLDDCWPDER